jgi:hypothetical protein
LKDPQFFLEKSSFEFLGRVDELSLNFGMVLNLNFLSKFKETTLRKVHDFVMELGPS